MTGARPSPSASFGPGSRKKGTSAPSAAASACSRSGSEGLRKRCVGQPSAAAASALPPPRPAATGISLEMRTCQAGSTPASAARRGARSRRSCRRKALDREPCPARARSGRRGRSAATPWRPRAGRRRRRGPTTSARLIFAAATARAGLMPREARRGGGTRPRASASARTFAGRPSSASAPAAALLGSARPASSSELASVLRRWANAAWATRRTDSSSELQGRVRRNATSAESTFGGGRKHVRATGWKPMRSVASCRTTDTAPYSFVPGGGEEAIRHLALHHHAPAARRSAAPEDSPSTIGVATL